MVNKAVDNKGDVSALSCRIGRSGQVIVNCNLGEWLLAYSAAGYLLPDTRKLA